jgi:recombination protein RecT
MCSPGSILGAMMTCAQLDLEPNTPNGLAYLIPYGRECQFQIGYKGLLQRMDRSGAVASFNADVVFKQEVEQGLFKYTSGIHPDIHHEINLLDGSTRSGNPADIVAAYACCVLKSGEPIIRLVTRKEIDQARAQGGRNSPAWRDHYAQMAIKTAIKRLVAWVPQTRMAEAFDIEDRYAKAVDVQAEAPQSGLSLEAMNAMMQAGQAQAVEAPQEAPAVEQAPAPQPEPVQAQPEPAPTPKEERPAAFRPAQEAQTAPKMPEPEAPIQPADPARAEADFSDYLADHDYPEGPARQYVGDMVRDGRAPDVATAKAMFVECDMGVDLQF